VTTFPPTKTKGEDRKSQGQISEGLEDKEGRKRRDSVWGVRLPRLHFHLVFHFKENQSISDEITHNLRKTRFSFFSAHITLLSQTTQICRATQKFESHGKCNDSTISASDSGDSSCRKIMGSAISSGSSPGSRHQPQTPH